jgi:hypothetical protein
MADSTMPDGVVVRSEVQNPGILRDLQKVQLVLFASLGRIFGLSKGRDRKNRPPLTLQLRPANCRELS